MQWKTRPLGYFSYTVLCCLCKRGDGGGVETTRVPLISIHAPARGATAEPPGRAVSTAYFNSRPCERGDVYTPDQMSSAKKISIHAPARGATALHSRN